MEQPDSELHQGQTLKADLKLEEISTFSRLPPDEAERVFKGMPFHKQLLTQLVIPKMLDIGTQFMTFDRAELYCSDRDDYYYLVLKGCDVKMRPVHRMVELGKLPIEQHH
jgi:hypothetical protein